MTYRTVATFFEPLSLPLTTLTSTTLPEVLQTCKLEQLYFLPGIDIQAVSCPAAPGPSAEMKIM